MKRLLLLFSLIPLGLLAQSKDEAEIRSLLDRQTLGWNAGDVASFMEGYWKNDSLMFIGSRGVTYGWTSTLNNYRKNYPDTASMGKLSFTILKMKKLSKRHYYVVGKWFLKRSIGDIGGHFDLLLEKIDGTWVIVSDHSS